MRAWNVRRSMSASCSADSCCCCWLGLGTVRHRARIGIFLEFGRGEAVPGRRGATQVAARGTNRELRAAPVP